MNAEEHDLAVHLLQAHSDLSLLLMTLPRWSRNDAIVEIVFQGMDQWDRLSAIAWPAFRMWIR